MDILTATCRTTNLVTKATKTLTNSGTHWELIGCDSNREML